MIKIITWDKVTYWIAVSAINSIEQTTPTKCTLYLRSGGTWDIPEEADALAKRVKTELREIHQTPDYRE